MTKILLVEDNRADARLFAELLREVPGQTFELTTVDTLAAAIAAARDHDVVFVDLSLPDAHGVSTVTAMVGAARSTPIVVLTGNNSEALALDAMKAGAQDYLTKSEITPSLIGRTARYAVERKHAEENARRLALSDKAAGRARLISSVTAAITASFELEVTLAEVAQLLVPALGDYAIIDLVLDPGRIARVAHAAADPILAGVLRATCPEAPEPDHAYHPVVRAIGSRASIMVSDLDGAGGVTDQLRTCSMLTTPLIARGRVVGAISYAMGPSQRRYDDELRALAEEIAERIALGIDNATLYHTAQRAIRGRDELLAVVSHDLRNPLGVVSLALGMMEGDPESLDAALPRAKRGVERMLRLIEDLLDLARIDSGTLGVEPRPTELGSVLDDVIEQHRVLAAAKNVSLVRGFDGRVGTAHVDRHRLQQALSNLLGNALKFTPAAGTIRLDAEARGEAVVIAVSDTGPGIAREHLEHIFDRFWQPEQRRDGVGLGLAIVKGIVDAHGGSIEVDSTVGAGATFKIALRRASRTTSQTLRRIADSYG